MSREPSSFVEPEGGQGFAPWAEFGAAPQGEPGSPRDRAASLAGRSAAPLRSSLALTCHMCGVSSGLSFQSPVCEINTPEPIKLEGSPCPCGGTFMAPAGRYLRRKETGTMERVGDYLPGSVN